MRLAAAVVALSTIAAPAFAQSSWFQVHGFLTARGYSVDSQQSWTQGGFGKFDVGPGPSGQSHTENVLLGQLGVDITPTSWFLLHADGLVRREPPNTVGEKSGFVQMFADLYTEKIRFRAGAFWLPTSRENVDPMWNSRYTITYSALNSWIAQEVRPVGADLQFSPDFYVTVGATAFKGLDTMGTALAARGWTFGNRLTVYNEIIALPPPGDVTRPLSYESGSNVGWSGRVRFQVPERAMLQLTHVDNRTATYPGTPPDEPWNTRFDIVGGELGTTGSSTLSAEWMNGKTAVAFPGGMFTMDFDTWYVLASQKSGKTRFTTRYERFYTRSHNPNPHDTHREDGHALTVAWLQEVSPHFRTALEYLKSSGERAAIPNPQIGGTQWSIELRYGF